MPLLDIYKLCEGVRDFCVDCAQLHFNYVEAEVPNLEQRRLKNAIQ
jgi:hypothetical protein